jgi:hypothetical protein
MFSQIAFLVFMSFFRKSKHAQVCFINEQELNLNNPAVECFLNII